MVETLPRNTVRVDCSREDGPDSVVVVSCCGGGEEMDKSWSSLSAVAVAEDDTSTSVVPLSSFGRLLNRSSDCFVASCASSRARRCMYFPSMSSSSSRLLLLRVVELSCLPFNPIECCNILAGSSGALSAAESTSELGRAAAAGIWPVASVISDLKDVLDTFDLPCAGFLVSLTNYKVLDKSQKFVEYGVFFRHAYTRIK